ncbi:aspartate carbamoyltransferase [Candidatus Woesearchaeota archaeon]|nr:aspartate carbamoyltransferase [Candidatus Woesearchaeota archaeon]
MVFKGRDIISIRDFSGEELLYVLSIARRMEQRPQPALMKGRIMASMFFEPSTRTRLSFTAAMKRMGGDTIGFAKGEVTSTKKGETLWDTVKMIEAYSDVIVIRHSLEGAARLSAEAASIPVINAGDGTNQHPTQTMIDLYTIQKEIGKLDGITIGFLGDLKYGRTVHSLAIALSHFKAKMYFISPTALKMPEYYLDELEQKRVTFHETDDVLKALKHLDVLYVTRIQQERFADPLEYEKFKNVYKVGPDILNGAKKSLIVLHPLPRVGEIDPALDEFPNAAYFRQAANGIPVRQAVLSLVLGAVK